MSRTRQRSASTHTSMRYRTIAAKGFHLGRLGVIFDVDLESFMLYVNIPSAHELQNLVDTGFENDFHVRLQLLPASPIARVTRTLFATDTPVSSAYLQHSHKHRATPNPAIEEEFAFDLAQVMGRIEEMRLYIAVISTAPVASDDTGFAGCVSFPLEMIIRHGQKMPRWYWLLNKRAGLEDCEPVEHVQVFDVRDQGPPGVPDVVVSGRRRGLPNAQMNGSYACRSEVFGQRRVYKQNENGLFMFFHAQRGSWAIADAVGHPAPYAFVDDHAEHPGSIRGVWQVFNREREFHTQDSKHRDQKHRDSNMQAARLGGGGSGGDGGSFEIDLHVTCRDARALEIKLSARRSPALAAGYQPLFTQMQLNPELSHRPEPEVAPILPRRPPPPSLASFALPPVARLPPLPPYMFPPMDTVDEVYGAEDD